MQGHLLPSCTVAHAVEDAPVVFVYSYIYYIDIWYLVPSWTNFTCSGRYNCCATLYLHLSQILCKTFVNYCHMLIKPLEDIRAKALKLSQDSFLVSVSVSSRWSLGLLGVWYLVSVPVSLTLKKRDRTRYRYRSLKKIETGLGLGIVNFKKTRPDSVSVSFTQKKRDRTRSRYRSL